MKLNMKQICEFFTAVLWTLQLGVSYWVITWIDMNLNLNEQGLPIQEMGKGLKIEERDKINCSKILMNG